MNVILKKITKAENLVASENPDNVAKAIDIYGKLCNNARLSPNAKMLVINSFSQHIPEEAQDMLARWRDTLGHIRNVEQLDKMIDLLIRVSRSAILGSHQRVVSVATLYNNYYYDVCYDCFADLACDKSLLVEYRVDCCRYLYGSESVEYRETACDILKEIIGNVNLESKFRYNIVVGFCKKKGGLKTFLNNQKLHVGYNEGFAYEIQNVFFYQDKNGVRERLLSGQNLLQMAIVALSQKSEIEEIILDVARNDANDQDTRADAADIVIREGQKDARLEAREIIMKIGKQPGNKQQTIYTDSQNIHAFTKDFDVYIQKLIENDHKLLPFENVQAAVSNLARKILTNNKDKFRVYESLNRISIDTAVFTNSRVTLPEILCHTWAKIHSFNPTQVEELKSRLIQELVEMSSTCSSGHGTRLVNVFSGFDDTLKISWDSQVIANVNARVNVRIRDCKDEELKGSLAMADSELASDEEKETYHGWLDVTLPEIRDEMEKEFVGDGYISLDDFQKYFATACKFYKK